MAYIYLKEERGIYFKFSGSVNADEILSVSEYLYGYDDYEQIEYELLDFRNADKLSLSYDDIEIISTLDVTSSIWNKKQAIAIIIDQKQGKEFEEFYKKMFKDSEWIAEYFTDEQSARNWIDKFAKNH